MPHVVIIAGPNGAGKTTFASDYLTGPRAHFIFVNADEIAREVARRGAPHRQMDIRAARIMLERIDSLVAAGADFAFETTLATLSYAQKIPVWRRSGYVASLVYLRLSSVEASIERVRRRVAAGGHGIPEEIIRRRFGTSAAYFEKLYKSIADRWYIFESADGEFVEGGIVGSEMKQTSEIAEIKAALKRAAYKAVHGTREERAGRFLPGKTRHAPSAHRTSKGSKLSRRKA